MHPLTFIKKCLKVGGCHFKTIIPIFSVILSATLSNSFANTKLDSQTDISCEDFLSEIHQKPSELKFDSCKRTNDAQLAVLKSSYSVSGKDAEKIESYLMNHFSMPKLKLVCCGWETSGGRGSFQYKDYPLAVAMYSNESLILDRNQWKDIPRFIVEVTLYLEEP